MILSTGTKGAVSELRVAVDLLDRGWEVFRSLSPTCSCDLIARRDGVTVDIEVRSGTRNKSGTLSYSQRNVRAALVAVVLPEGGIEYIPEIRLFQKS